LVADNPGDRCEHRGAIGVAAQIGNLDALARRFREHLAPAAGVAAAKAYRTHRPWGPAGRVGGCHRRTQDALGRGACGRRRPADDAATREQVFWGGDPFGSALLLLPLSLGALRLTGRRRVVWPFGRFTLLTGWSVGIGRIRPQRPRLLGNRALLP